MHIGMNMMSTVAISSLLEKRMGSIQHALTILWAILLTSVVYTAAAVLLYLSLGMEDLMYQHSVGFSGVIFHLSVLECNLTPHRSRSVFGFLTVPAYLYPWALLLVLQLVMPNLSFMGHLAGILTGTLQFYGVLDVFLVSDTYTQKMESWAGLRLLTAQPSFIATPVSLDTEPVRHDPADLRRAVGNGVMLVVGLVKNIAETLYVFIFGRGGDANANIQLGVGDAVDFEEEDDWVGLPPMSASGRDGESRIV